MNLHSVKSRFLGSYLLLIFLFIVQLPIIYVLVGGMSQKYSQVVEAASLRKRAVEINYILNRHIMNGEEELDKVFFQKKEEFGQVIDNLRKGTKDVPAIEDPAVLARLDVVAQRWVEMGRAMDEAMESGDDLTEVIAEIENTTYPLVDKMNTIVKGFVALKDPSYGKSIDLAGLQRMRTVDMAYLSERYARSNYELDNVSSLLAKSISNYEATLSGLRTGSSELGLKPAGSPEIARQLYEAEGHWTKRKMLISTVMKNKDVFQSRVMELANVHTPAIVAAAEELTTQIAVSARNAAMNAILLMAASILVTAAIAVFFMWSTNTHILRPMMRIKETVEGFTNGDLSRRADIKVNFFGKELKDEVTSLGASVDDMAGQMSNVIGRIADSSNLLASTSEQLSASSSQISDGANRQSAQTGQVATAMEEMNATVIEVAKNSQQASESARTAKNIANEGGSVVTQAISAMQEVAQASSVTATTIKKLGKSSEEIGTIVSVINDIADQTNLLALNAAIEAARAGEQGRGFAVVADEVRKLAERTTKATKEISEMIKTIQQETTTAVDAMAEGTLRVENGVKLANDTGEALKKIVKGVEGVTEMISHIATSAEEQSATTDEITQNMESIAEVAKTNVNAIGEVAKATDEMARVATELKDLVSKFRIEENRGEVVHLNRNAREDVRKFKKASGHA